VWFQANTRHPAGFAGAFHGYPLIPARGKVRSAEEAESRNPKTEFLKVRDEVQGNEVTAGVAWLWCIAGSLASWVLVAWAVELVV